MAATAGSTAEPATHHTRVGAREQLDTVQALRAVAALCVVALYWLCTIALFVLALAVPQLMGATRGDASELVKSLLFFPFVKSNGNVHPLLYLGWTLNYEMLFYGLFALALVVAPRRAHAVAVGVLLALFALGQLIDFDNVALKFWTAPIVLDFVYGIAAYHVWRSGALARLPVLAAVLLAIGAWLLMAAWRADETTR